MREEQAPSDSLSLLWKVVSIWLVLLTRMVGPTFLRADLIREVPTNIVRDSGTLANLSSHRAQSFGKEKATWVQRQQSRKKQYGRRNLSIKLKHRAAKEPYFIITFTTYKKISSIIKSDFLALGLMISELLKLGPTLCIVRSSMDPIMCERATGEERADKEETRPHTLR